MDYYLMQNGDRTGPYKVFQIVEMLRTNEVKDTDMAWCEEVDAWMPLKEMPPLEGILGDERQESVDEIVVKIDEKDAKARAERAQPWMRFLARTIDCWIVYQIAIVISVITGIFQPAAIFPRSLAEPEPGDALTLISLAVVSSYIWVFIEAWTISKWGTTPGKALFRIRVLTESGGHLDFSQSMRRAFSVWIRGYALGILYIQFVTFLASFLYLRQDGHTPWDANQSLQVSHQPISQRRWIAVFAVAFGMLLVKGAVPLALNPELRANVMKEIREKAGSGSPSLFNDSAILENDDDAPLA